MTVALIFGVGMFGFGFLVGFGMALFIGRDVATERHALSDSPVVVEFKR